MALSMMFIMDSEAESRRKSVHQHDGIIDDAKLQAERTRVSNFNGVHSTILQEDINNMTFAVLKSKIERLPSLDYPPDPYSLDHRCNSFTPIRVTNKQGQGLINFILDHPPLNNIERSKLIDILCTGSPAYADGLCQNNIIEGFLAHSEFHAILKKMYIILSSQHAAYNFEERHEIQIWNLLIQESTENLKQHFKPIFERINRSDSSKLYMCKRLLRFALHWLKLATTSEQVIDVYNKIKTIFSTCERLNKYSSLLHQAANTLVNQLQREEKGERSERVWGFLGEDHGFRLFSCFRNSKSQRLNQQIRENKKGYEGELKAAVSTTEAQLNDKLKEKFGFKTTLRRL